MSLPACLPVAGTGRRCWHAHVCWLWLLQGLARPGCIHACCYEPLAKSLSVHDAVTPSVTPFCLQGPAAWADVGADPLSGRAVCAGGGHRCVSGMMGSQITLPFSRRGCKSLGSAAASANPAQLPRLLSCAGPSGACKHTTVPVALPHAVVVARCEEGDARGDMG